MVLIVDVTKRKQVRQKRGLGYKTMLFKDWKNKGLLKQALYHVVNYFLKLFLSKVSRITFMIWKKATWKSIRKKSRNQNFPDTCICFFQFRHEPFAFRYSFWSDIHQFVRTFFINQQVLYNSDIFRRNRGREKSCIDAKFIQSHQLIFHQRNERRNNLEKGKDKRE